MSSEAQTRAVIFCVLVVIFQKIRDIMESSAPLFPQILCLSAVTPKSINIFADPLDKTKDVHLSLTSVMATR